MVERLWPGEPFLICGAGPSLCADDLAVWRAAQPRPRLIVINNAYQLAPDADVLYAADAQWWQWQAAIADAAMPRLKFAAQRSARSAALAIRSTNSEWTS